MAIEFAPSSPNAGTALFFFDGHRYERVNYRIGKGQAPTSRTEDHLYVQGRKGHLEAELGEE